VIIVDDSNSFCIILHKELIKQLNGSFIEKESKETIPHPKGGFFTLHNEPFIGDPVETHDELSDQLLFIDSDINNWIVQ
jgi:hypothetical protein